MVRTVLLCLAPHLKAFLKLKSVEGHRKLKTCSTLLINASTCHSVVRYITVINMCIQHLPGFEQ